MQETVALIRKEINSYFSSMIAIIFIGVFTLGALFTFFYVEGFWARNLADVRPLFRWLPILLIFLASALTMRQWSEEEQSGTLELLLILPVRLVQLILAKFFSALILIALALALTFFLPIMVAFYGDLDWGPVLGGYVAALLLAAMYISIGLFISSRTSSQLVALILSVLVNGAFYLAGSAVIARAVSPQIADILQAVGSGARFDSIERGVLDLRDLAYFLTITIAFLALNVLSLDSRRWGHGAATFNYRFNINVGIILIVLNALLMNMWLYPLRVARLDLTENKIYSLSDITRETLQNLSEPLLIRAYLSQETLPELKPLIAQLTDTLREYEIAGEGNVTVEIIDPAEDEAAQDEAEQVYGIRPTPAQVADRLESKIINLYFDVLLVYGDQNTVLGLNDLIEVDRFGENDFELRFGNLEYDLTSSIRRLVSGFQSIDVALENLPQPARLTLYYTPSTLPETYAEVPNHLQTIADDLNVTGKFEYQVVDLDDPNAPETPDSLLERYEIQPLATDLFATNIYYLHGVLEANGQIAVLRLPPATTEPELREMIEGTLKRFSGGFLPVIGIWTPPAQSIDQFGQQSPTAQSYQSVQSFLRSNYEMRTVDLSSGNVAGDIDVLFLINPQNLTQIERYAVDQYLMRGGTLFVTTSSYQYGVDPLTGWISIAPVSGGINDLLANYGVSVDSRIVMDTQNMQIIDVSNNGQIIQYRSPHFIDVRDDGLSDDSLITRNIAALVVSLASSLQVNAPEGVAVERLINTSDQAWDSLNTRLKPPASGNYNIDGDTGKRLLGVALTGQFQSFFTQPEGETVEPSAPNALPEGVEVQPLTQSPQNTRLVVIGSAEFLNDYTPQIAPENRSEYTALLIQNLIDWATSDADLLDIRAADTQLRLLEPMEKSEQQMIEVALAALDIFALIMLGGMWLFFRRSERPMPLWHDDAIEEEAHAAA